MMTKALRFIVLLVLFAACYAQYDEKIQHAHKSTRKSASAEGLIAHGQKAKEGDFPWAALIFIQLNETIGVF